MKYSEWKMVSQNTKNMLTVQSAAKNEKGAHQLEWTAFSENYLYFLIEFFEVYLLQKLQIYI